MQEFVAHSGPVRVARLGTKSGQVLATGGEDKRVNVWKIGRTSALMSLSGHSSAIDALTFDRTEETLVAGCSGGSLKIWSLEAQKVAGTLTGHRTSCSAVAGKSAAGCAGPLRRCAHRALRLCFLGCSRTDRCFLALSRKVYFLSVPFSD